MDKFEWWFFPSLIAALIVTVAWFAKTMHQQAMAKFDKLIDKVGEMTTQQALHDSQLMAGSKQFQKIETHQEIQDQKIEKIDKRLTGVEFKIEQISKP